MCPFCLRMSWKLCQKTIAVQRFKMQSDIHTTAVVNSSRQAANAMRKILGVNKKRKYVHYEGVPSSTPESFSKGSLDGRPSTNSRRAAVLNKLFMENITDLMATGEYASEIVGHGIEINSVKIAPDYKCLNVYWVARDSVNDQAIDEILKKNAGFLRHELSQLRVMGNVPNIQFVKDKRYARIVALENRLVLADFGQDYVPVDDAAQMKSQFELYAPPEDDIERRTALIDGEQSKDGDEKPLPTMPQNVLGLDHAAILNRIRKQVKKSEASHRQTNDSDEANESWVTFKLNQSVNDDPVSMGSSKAQREAFREFLQKRQATCGKKVCLPCRKSHIPGLCVAKSRLAPRLSNLHSRPGMSGFSYMILRMRARRREKNYTPDREYEREMRRVQLENLMKYDDFVDQEDDYVLEDVDEKV